MKFLAGIDRGNVLRPLANFVIQPTDLLFQSLKALTGFNDVSQAGSAPREKLADDEAGGWS